VNSFESGEDEKAALFIGFKYFPDKNHMIFVDIHRILW